MKRYIILIMVGPDVHISEHGGLRRLYNYEILLIVGVVLEC